MNTAKDSSWIDGEEGKEVEWTDFGSNAFFGTKSQEETTPNAPTRTNAEQVIRDVKSAQGRLRPRRIKQKSLDRRRQQQQAVGM